jgi:hypothetical protein
MAKRIEVSALGKNFQVVLNHDDGKLLQEIAFQYNDISKRVSGYGLYSQEELRNFLILFFTKLSDAEFFGSTDNYNFTFDKKGNQKFTFILTDDEKRMLNHILYNKEFISELIANRGIYGQMEVVSFVHALYAELWFAFAD